MNRDRVRSALVDYDQWEADRRKVTKREDDPYDLPSASEWAASDDTAVELLRSLVDAVRDAADGEDL